MVYIPILLVALFTLSICNSYNAVPISNFERKEIQFSNDEKYVVFKYNNEGGINSEITITIHSANTLHLYVYLYLNISDIKQDSNNNFINYVQKKNNIKSIYFITDKKLNGEFYLVMTQNNYNNKLSISIISSASHPYILSSDLFSHPFSCYSKNLTYFFQIPSNNNHSYLRYEFDGLNYLSAKITIYDENDRMIEQSEDKVSLEKIIRIDIGTSYTISLQLTHTPAGLKNSNLYLMLTDYKKLYPLQIDNSDIQEFYYFSKLFLILNMTSIQNQYNAKIEFNYSTSISNPEFYRYETDDIEEIESISGEKMEIIKDEKASNIYYIYKNTSNFKNVVIKITAQLDVNTLKIKYLGQYQNKSTPKEKNDIIQNEETPTDSVVGSILLGLGLSLPNLIFQFYRMFKKEFTAPWINIGMDALWHFAYANLLAKAFSIGGSTAVKIGAFSAGLYFFCLVYFFGKSLNDKNNSKGIFSHLIHSFTKFEELKTLDELISYNRKLPPNILIKARAYHQETRNIVGKVTDYGFGDFHNIKTDLHATEWKRDNRFCTDTIYYADDPLNSHKKLYSNKRKQISHDF